MGYSRELDKSTKMTPNKRPRPLRAELAGDGRLPLGLGYVLDFCGEIIDFPYWFVKNLTLSVADTAVYRKAILLYTLSFP